MKRGEVWWAELPPPIGRRPAVLLSRDAAYAVRTQITVALVTTTVRGIRSEVLLGPDDGLPRVCAANLDTINTIPKTSLQQRITLLNAAKLRAVDAAIRYALALKQ